MGGTWYAKGEQRKALKLKNAEIIGRMYCEGKTQGDIAKHLGISRMTVSRGMKLIRQIWMERIADRIDAHKAEQLAKIDRIEAEAWDAWERSKKAAREYRIQDEDGEHAKTVKTKVKKHRDGEVRFLELASKQVELRMKLLGLNREESGTGTATPLLEVIVSTRAEAAKMLPYTQFASEVIEGQVVAPQAPQEAEL